MYLLLLKWLQLKLVILSMFSGILKKTFVFPFQAFEAEVKASKGLVDNRFYEYEIYIHTVYKVSFI